MLRPGFMPQNNKRGVIQIRFCSPPLALATEVAATQTKSAFADSIKKGVVNPDLVLDLVPPKLGGLGGRVRKS